MKKFKTKKKDHAKIILIFFVIIIFIIFIYLSLQKINKSYDSMINFVLKDLSKEKIVFRKNFNYLINDYVFKEKTIVSKEKYQLLLDHNSDSDLGNLLIEKLNKLGIKISSIGKNSNNDYYFCIKRGNNSDIATIDNRDYAKISVLTSNKFDYEKLKQYLDNNYSDIVYNFSSKDDVKFNTIFIEIGGDNNSYDEMHNSTEIIALMIYNYFGDK